MVGFRYNFYTFAADKYDATTLPLYGETELAL